MDTWFVGELLMRLECGNSERFEQAEYFRARYTGAEANAAIAMSRLGAKNVHLLSAVPDHPLGENCLRELGKFGPDTSQVLRRPNGRLGLFFWKPVLSYDHLKLFMIEPEVHLHRLHMKRMISPPSFNAILLPAGSISPAHSRP